MANKLQILGKLIDAVMDATLSIEGAAADAKATGDAIKSVSALVGNEPVSEQITKAMQENNVDLTGYATESYVGDAIAAIDYPVNSVNGKTGEVTLTANEIGADVSGTAISAVSEHNTSIDAHNDIRMLIEGLTTRLNVLADSDDTTLDQMSEIVEYIKSNKTLIENITTNKINVSDIIDNLATNVSDKPLSAAQGVELKSLIDNLDNNKLDSSTLADAVNVALSQAKESGEFDGVGIASVTQTTTSIEDDGDNIITVTLTNGTTSTFTIQNGSKGSKGDSPVRGTDYWTDEDKTEIKSYVDEAILGGAW
jgi:hypothetical protein